MALLEEGEVSQEQEVREVLTVPLEVAGVMVAVRVVVQVQLETKDKINKY